MRFCFASRLVSCFVACLAGSLAGCDGTPAGPALAVVDLGPALGATRGDPLLLTFAAARPRARYLVDQGYTLAWDERHVPSFTTESAGDLGVIFEVDGFLYESEDDFATPVSVDHAASDAAVVSFDIDDLLSAEIWFVVGSSRAVTLDVRLRSTALYDRHVSVIPWLRRCDEPFTAVTPLPHGLSARRSVTPDPRLATAGPGTFVTAYADGLVGEEPPVTTLGSFACHGEAFDDLGVMINEATPPPARATQLALRFDRVVASQSTAEIRVHRAAVDAAEASTLAAELQAEQALDLPGVLREGQARVDAARPLAGLSPADALVYRSSFTLLDQVTMPAEGRLAHDYYVFSREPTWWSARLGQSTHESLAMILLARSSPAEAVAQQRNFIDRIEADGYLPCSIGPIVDQTRARAAAAPLFSFESWEIAQRAGDPAFLADAYAAGERLHGFWVAQRDADHDGLSEWGGVGLVESLRSEGNVIWSEVAAPDQVEAVDLNAMLVMEEKSLAAMATALGKAGEAAQWQSAASARAARINAVMWDEATGFYYPVARDTETFTIKTEGDLKRREIAGLLPLWAGIVPDDRRARLVAQLADPAVFLRSSGVASLSAKDPFYAAQAGGWNGPVFVPWEWLVVRGLIASGENALAREITARTAAAVGAELARDHQFRELYDPDDATRPNFSRPNYLWSSMAALLMLETTPTP